VKSELSSVLLQEKRGKAEGEDGERTPIQMELFVLEVVCTELCTGVLVLSQLMGGRVSSSESGEGSDEEEEGGRGRTTRLTETTGWFATVTMAESSRGPGRCEGGRARASGELAGRARERRTDARSRTGGRADRAIVRGVCGRPGSAAIGRRARSCPYRSGCSPQPERELAASCGRSETRRMRRTAFSRASAGRLLRGLSLLVCTVARPTRPAWAKRELGWRADLVVSLAASS